MVEVLLDGSADIEVGFDYFVIYIGLIRPWTKGAVFILLHFQIADAEGCRPLHHASRYCW